MSKYPTRRAVVKGCSLAGVGLTAGCIVKQQGDITVLDLLVEGVLSEGDPWELAVRASLESKVNPDEKAFHDVTLLGYSNALREVGRTPIGTVTGSTPSGDEVVELECDGFPFMLTFDARETPCDDRTRIDIADYSGKHPDGTHIWTIRRTRECGHGLPPRSPDSTVTPPPTSNEE